MAKKKPIAVSDLAQLATCQRKVYLAAKLGERATKDQQRQRAEGIRLHQLAYEQPHPSMKKRDGRCFIATAVFGEVAPETELLRTFRDERLLTNRTGRILVQMYYRISPPIAEALLRWPTARRGVAWVLRKMIGLFG